ncbi:hypothetical protein RB2654_14780 [Rhodobacterales bacterium HTCC2654]|uniref:Uncharacterized protein n=1 Tax=Maritimibacter alkaliphilus HTCC2654 TaxID=314271 RepID=A3VH05_9RHOB|nr:hypothetical protein RB2654_14780 [Rhodobacterales bacterium HTCC2654] [Maritimibacter alkaliphilus HTCC2654]
MIAKSAFATLKRPVYSPSVRP